MSLRAFTPEGIILMALRAILARTYQNTRYVLYLMPERRLRTCCRCGVQEIMGHELVILHPQADPDAADAKRYGICRPCTEKFAEWLRA